MQSKKKFQNYSQLLMFVETNGCKAALWKRSQVLFIAFMVIMGIV